MARGDEYYLPNYDRLNVNLNMAKKFNVVFEFPNKQLRAEFLGWMSDGGGEQGFFDALDVRYQPSVDLDYKDDFDSSKENLTIKAKIR